jgi:hypothetical protein
MYHSSETARDRDRLRQDHLERLGWKFHRIWSTDWFHHRESEVARTVDAFNTALTEPDVPNPPPSVAPQHATEDVAAATAAGASERTLPRPGLPQSLNASPVTWDVVPGLAQPLRGVVATAA